MISSRTTMLFKLFQPSWRRMTATSNSRRLSSNFLSRYRNASIFVAKSQFPFSSSAASSSAIESSTAMNLTTSEEDKDRLERKLAQLSLIQKHVEGLQENWEKEMDAFSNVQWETSAEIEALFADSQSKKKEIRDSIEELQNLMKEAKVVFELALQTEDAESAKVRLEKLSTKIDHCKDIEANLAELEDIYHQKQEHYNNIGLRTAAEIDRLFQDSKLKKDNIENSVHELKKVIEDTLQEF